MTMFFLF